MRRRPHDHYASLQTSRVISTTVPEEHQKVLEAPFAVLTTLGRDGYPQSTMVTFLTEDGLVRISLNTTRQKTRNLMASPYRTLELRGDVEITPTTTTASSGCRRKYGGTDFRYTDRPGESRVGVVLRPVRVNVTDLRSPAGS